MITLLDLSFWINFLYFFLAVLVAFFIPGDILIGRRIIGNSRLSRIILGVILGIAMWAWQAMIFGYLEMRNLSYVYVLVFVFVWIKINFYGFKKSFLAWSKSKKFKVDYILIALILFGLVVQLAPVWGFALKFDKGLFLCCGNREDIMFHYALSSSIIRNFPPYEPGMTGVF